MAQNYEIPTPKKRLLSLQMDPAKFEKATDEEKKQQDVMAESTTFFKDGMRRLRKNPLAVFSIIVLLLIVRDKQAANLKPFEYSAKEQAYMEKYNVKVFPHILGTDELCRD